MQNAEVEYSSALVNYRLHVDTSATNKCPDPDHSLSGNKEVTCQASGQWQPDLPTCIKGITTRSVSGIVMLDNRGDRFWSVTIDLHW